jgi:demethylmenaquinone methyltransferase/2-methoxy-6-polyprenyl-1,4-benzoquinol methylase
MTTEIMPPQTPAEKPVETSEARIRRMFGKIAPRYDLLNHLLSLNIDRYWRWQTVRLVAPQGDAPLLDLCTGTGDLALAYHKASGGKTPVVGADFCYEMLELAQRKAAKLASAQRPVFIEADTMRLPLESDTYQIVSVAFGLRNVADTDAGLREMVRVCRPGGRVAVLEFSTPPWQPLRGIYQAYFRYVLPKIGQWLSRSPDDAYSYLPASVGQFPCGEALATRMRAAGLNEVWFRRFTCGVVTLYVGVKPKSEVPNDEVSC